MAFFDRMVARRLAKGRAIHKFGVLPTEYGEFVRSRESKKNKTILYLPGGAFLVRTPNAHRQLVFRLCEATNTDAAIVHYRLAPEHLFPAALDDALAAYRSLLADGETGSQIILMGDSAGGGLALSTLLALRDAGDPLPLGLVAMSPLADLTFSGQSRQRNRIKDPMLPTARSGGDARFYAGNMDPSDPLISPVFGDYAGMPPMLLQVGSDEISLDDTLRVAKRAIDAGVRAEASVWEKMPHVWHIFPQLPESKNAIESIGNFVADIC